MASVAGIALDILLLMYVPEPHSRQRAVSKTGSGQTFTATKPDCGDSNSPLLALAPGSEPVLALPHWACREQAAHSREVTKVRILPAAVTRPPVSLMGGGTGEVEDPSLLPDPLTLPSRL